MINIYWHLNSDYFTSCSLSFSSIVYICISVISFNICLLCLNWYFFHVGPINSPHVSLHLSARTREPLLVGIEVHTQVKCYCSPHHTPSSPRLCAIVHLHTHRQTHRNTHHKRAERHGKELQWPVINYKVDFSTSVSTLAHLPLCMAPEAFLFCFIFSLVPLKKCNFFFSGLYTVFVWQNSTQPVNAHKHAPAKHARKHTHHTVILFTNH